MTEIELLIARAKARYDALTSEEKANYDYEQRRSFVRGMCPDNRDYNSWCREVDKLLPPLWPKAK